MLSSFLIFSLISLSALGQVSGAVLPRRASSLRSRALAKGWSLQSNSCPSDTTSCGGGSCCPSNLFCSTAANDEVAACCPTNSPCRGAIENTPVCADPSWSLWKGLNGNGFCCEVDMVGIYDWHHPVAGTCVSSANGLGATPAVLMSPGSGAAATVPPVASTAPADPVLATTAVPLVASTVASDPVLSTAAVPPVASTAASDPVLSTATSIPADIVPSVASSVPSVAQTIASATATGATASAMPTSTTPGSTNKPVFFHYMIGTTTDAHCEQDILDAQKLGVDAFALNLNTVTQSWATNTVASLFKSANKHGFKLFFSFDMTGFNDPGQFTSFLATYVTDPAHYKYNNLPFVSTFNGGANQYTFGQSSVNNGWKIALQQAMANMGHPIYFVPAFQDAPNGAADFFKTYPGLDGAMNWNSWAFDTQGKIPVPTTDDVAYLTGAHALGKTFMMGVSPLQFKHMDGGNNWYRRGEQGLELRLGQVLSMQPDFVELQTWNDAGESHYMGNSWPEPIAGTNIGAYSDGYDHTGYWEILPAFIKAYKAGSTSTSTMYPTNGQTSQGVFWHHTLLANSNCGADGMGKPRGIELVEDLVTVVILVAAGTTDLRVDVKSGSNHLGGTTLVPGFNSYSVEGLTAGTVTVTVSSSAGAVVRQASGPIAVASSGNLYNYNFQVVGL